MHSANRSAKHDDDGGACGPGCPSASLCSKIRLKRRCSRSITSRRYCSDVFDQPRRPWRTVLIVVLTCVLASLLITERSAPTPPLVEAHELIDAACETSDIHSDSFSFFLEDDSQPSRCTDAFRVAADDLGFSDADVAETIEVESNVARRAGSLRLSSQLVNFGTSASPIEVVMLEIASCERKLLDASPGFEVSQLMDRIWSSNCDTEFYVNMLVPASAESD